MSLSIGIAGLPNVGKSTLFNALTKTQNAESQNYPFCTIEPNKAIVPVPDERLYKLAELVNPKKITPATVEFVDIAGLVEGASKGEGLGNKFLGNIRQTSAIVHVVRCFKDDNVVHVSAEPDPKRDVETIETELALADLEQLERKIERLEKQVKADKKLKPVLELAARLKEHLEQGKPVNSFEQADSEAFENFVQEMGFITAKTVIFAANVDEQGLLEDNEYTKTLSEIAENRGAELVKICAKLEEDMVDMTDNERAEFLESMGVEESGLEKVIHHGFDALGLMSYFTAGPKEVRAWTIKKGWTAPQAAGVIHTDFERGFIRAEVISYEDYIECGSENAAKDAGKMAAKGKAYVVNDGDVVNFLFNV
ncbi:Ribosome-binding ATPase YchF [Sedimentisphaera cyanobacteriorum]|uniref:Ribosome-binding ATPase YchF n=1 Tax=Sedimentisphaera cyanobacteriorum TaxID=1940790 RepID=A0A1Q2HRL8_9BACT|nr:redox-regulated ATPase YchF [Sedimentisphaera cyanobacteriorum]AQQ10040.1 Ribosome-binding ATPase YchF [Sedimentisphaera cyanobacteriorum]